MKKLLAVLALVGLVSAPAFAAPVSRVCESQVRNYVEGTLGLRITSMHWDFNQNGGGSESGGPSGGGRVWLTVDSCSGNVVVNLNMMADYYSCFQQSYYGSVPNFIEGVWATGNCRVRR